jgi:chromosome segregation ATPase
MLKKMLIAAVAVVAGMVVLTKVTKISPMVWFGDCCRTAQRMVPPEVQLKQLNHEIDKIDGDIRKNISRLAHMEVEVKMFEEKLDRKREKQAKLRADIRDMQKSLQAQTEKVAFRGHKVRSTELTNSLDIAVTEFTSLKEQIKVQEELLTNKKRTLDVARSRITEMRNEQEKLRLLATKLATNLELVRMKQVQSQEVVFDNSALDNARSLAKDVEVQIRTAEQTLKLQAEFGLADKLVPEKEGKSREEVLKAAQAVLDDNQPLEKVAADEKDE